MKIRVEQVCIPGARCLVSETGRNTSLILMLDRKWTDDKNGLAPRGNLNNVRLMDVNIDLSCVAMSAPKCHLVMLTVCIFIFIIPTFRVLKKIKLFKLSN